jgi:hypothetical protein
VRLAAAGSAGLGGVAAVFARAALGLVPLGSGGLVDGLQADTWWGSVGPEPLAAWRLAFEGLWALLPAGPLPDIAMWSGVHTLEAGAFTSALVLPFVFYGLARGSVTPSQSPSRATAAFSSGLVIDGRAPVGATEAGASATEDYPIFAPGPGAGRARRVGSRDYAPHLLGALGPVLFVAFELQLSTAADVDGALALARPFVIVVLGLGIGAIGGRAGSLARTAMFAGTLVAFTLAAAHLFGAARADKRVLASSVARHLVSSGAQGDALLACGPRAPAVVWAYRLQRAHASTRLVASHASALEAAFAETADGAPAHVSFAVEEAREEPIRELLEEAGAARGYVLLDRAQAAGLVVLRWTRQGG